MKYIIIFGFFLGYGSGWKVRIGFIYGMYFGAGVMG